MVTPSTPSADNPKNGAVEPQKKRPDTSAWLTREESAHLLGVSVQTIKNYEERGMLRSQLVPRKGDNGPEKIVAVYDPRALADLNMTLKTKAGRELAIDTSTWLTRNESTDMLSVSTQTLKNYERQGKLHPRRVPRRDARGHEQVVVVYDPNELAKLPRGKGVFAWRHPGELQARCFEMFEQQKSFREIVIALRETSDTIHAFHERWLDDGGSFLVISEVAKSDLEALVGPFVDVTELVELVTAKLGEKPNNPAP